jgi:hypothetical protein
MLSSRVCHRLSLVASGERADWISLGGGATPLILVAWALAAGFALGGVVLAAAASFLQPDVSGHPVVSGITWLKSYSIEKVEVEQSAKARPGSDGGMRAVVVAREQVRADE